MHDNEVAVVYGEEAEGESRAGVAEGRNWIDGKSDQSGRRREWAKGGSGEGTGH